MVPQPVRHAPSTRYSRNASSGSAHVRKTPRQTRPRRRQINCCYWFKWLFFCACVLAGVFTGLYVGLGKSSSKSDNFSTYPPIRNSSLPSNATVYDLAATECEPGTFILHQDMFGGIWIRGEFHDSVSMNSSSMVPTKLHFTGDLSPQKPANMTAVCWPVPGTDVARIALFFVSPFPDPAFKYAIIETTIDVSTTNFTLIDYPTYSDTHNAIIKVRDASAMAAVVLPSEGVRLYYSELLSDRKKVNIMEVTRGWPEPTVYFNGQYATKRDLYAKAYRTWTPLAAAAVDRNNSISPPEVHVFFVDRKSRLSRVVRKGTETWPAQPLTQYSTAGGSDMKIQKMVAIIPHITNGHLEPDLFFINNHRVTDIFGTTNAPTNEDVSTASRVYVQAPKIVGGDISGPSSIPQAVQSPPLIAVTCWNFRDNRTMSVQASSSTASRERMQLFYVKQDVSWYDRGNSYENVQILGQGIVKVTARSDPLVGYHWNWTEAANDTRRLRH